MATDFILGTAGHIDHGKTSLIRALTGVDTDRLPEEKRRGITIDLGFAQLEVGDYRLGIVDVPGHERFVRNMLAGATSMDLAMLVIAADDSVKQQTREHLDILRMLDLKAGLIVLTKCDLVEPSWLELVEQEIRDFVAGSFLEQAPIVRTSATTGVGLDQLRAELLAAAVRAERAGALTDRGPFRLAIDRSFTLAGHGTVVTGSVSSGKARVGDELLIEPGGIPVRIRGLHNHDQAVEEVRRGQRAAVNLAGIHHEAIHRGHELASPGHLQPSKLLSAVLTLLPDAPPLKSRSRVRLHVGTAEILASVVLLSGERLLPGQSAPAQLFLAEPAVTTWNQPLVIRSESPVATLGGGRVLDPCAERLRKPDEVVMSQLAELRSAKPIERASAAIFFAGLRNWHWTDLPRLAGIEGSNPLREELLAQGVLREISVSPTRTMRLHRLVMERVGERICAALLALHARFPLRSMFPREMVVQGFQYVGEAPVLDAILRVLQTAGKVRVTEHGLALVGQGPKLSKNEQILYAQILEWFRTAGIEPPTPQECQQRATKNQASVPQLLALAVADGELLEIGQDWFLHSQCEAVARGKVAAHPKMAEGGAGLTLSEIRELLGTSRKFAVPLCEYWDKTGFTRRQGDLRVLAAPRA